MSSAASGDSTLSIYCSIYNVDFHRNSASLLIPFLQNQSKVPWRNLKWHEVVVHKNVFRDSVSMWRCSVPIHTVARWVKAFREGRAAVQNNLRTGRPHMGNGKIQLLTSLLDADRQKTAHELAAEVWVCHKRLHILQDILGYRKLAARWIPHEISELQQWHRYAVARALVVRYQRAGDDFLEQIVAVDKICARSYQPNLKCQSNEWKHHGFPHPKKVRLTQCPVKAMFIVEYDVMG